jgi:site-specific recombinase XerD
LRLLIGAQKKRPVFLSQCKHALTARAINHIVAHFGKWAGLTNFYSRLRWLNPNLFRHSSARFLKSKGFSSEWIQNILAHTCYKATMDMYGTLSIDEMQEVAVQKLGA